MGLHCIDLLLPWTCLTLCMLVIFFMLLPLIFFQKFYQEHYQSVKRFGSRSGPADLDPNCLQRFSADDKSRR